MDIKEFIKNLPEVSTPQRKLDLREKLMWSGLVLVIYFILSFLPLYGLHPTYQAQFESLAILMAAQFGSVITLGIGPIVTASIILQLLMGAEVIKIDTRTQEGKKFYQGVQKILSILFIIFENTLYVVSGSLPPAIPSLFNQLLLITQLVIGGIILMFLDEVSSKWGIGSGISLFIAAGVSRRIFNNAINPLPDPSNPSLPTGRLPLALSLFLQGIPEAALWPIFTVVATVLVFAMAVYVQAIDVEIPLSFARIRGYSIKWPLKFVYTSNIPVILVAAFIGTLTMFGQSLYNAGVPILGTFEEVTTSSGGVMLQPKSGLVYYLNPPTFRDIIVNGLSTDYILSILIYMGFMIGGSILFSILWANVGGQDADSVAEQISSTGLFIPGFRQNKDILARILKRYINPLTVMGGATVGFLAGIATLSGALANGTGILLTVMIIYQFYEQILRDHSKDMPESLKSLFGK